jgi:hypothetical protein
MVKFTVEEMHSIMDKNNIRNHVCSCSCLTLVCAPIILTKLIISVARG